MGSLLRSVFPDHCAICRVRGAPLCEPCGARLSPAPEPGPGDVDHLDGVAALFEYSGAGRTAIARLKYDNHRDAIDTYAHLLLGAIDVVPDLVTWVPTSGGRRRSRGYDQAELLARATGKAARVPAVATLQRRSDVDQIGRSRAQRRELRFDVRPGRARRLAGASVLIVDDVRTSGASLDGAAIALRNSGVAAVFGATVAATAPRSKNIC